MIDALYHLDSRTAVGVLARAALSLDGDGNPAAKMIIENENIVREKVIVAARTQLGISSHDDSEEARERIGDFLDQQSDNLIGPSDTDAALRRLAESGALPSDMYEIQFAPNLTDFCAAKTYDLEKELIEATVRQPDQEQHFAQSPKVSEPSLVSLFYRHFRTKYQFKDFNVLVAASRNGLVLNVAQAWRIYPALLDTGKASSLVDVLRMFANEYGANMQWQGKTGSFFLTVEQEITKSFVVQFKASGKDQKVGFAQVVQHQNGNRTAALVVFIDLLRYHAMLDRMEVGRSQIAFKAKVAEDRVAF